MQSNVEVCSFTNVTIRCNLHTLFCIWATPLRSQVFTHWVDWAVTRIF